MILASMTAIAFFTGDIASFVGIEDDVAEVVVITADFVVFSMFILSVSSVSAVTVDEESDCFKKCRPYKFKSFKVTILFGSITSKVQYECLK